jgi:uncharacterized protein YkwD
MRLPTALRTLVLSAAVVAPLGVAGPAHAVDARAAQTACPAAAVAPAPENVTQLERTTLCLVNLERSQRGLRALRSNGRLAKAADGHSRDMVRRDFFSHDGPGGSTMSSRIKRAGYLNGARSYTFAENIAYGTGSYGTPISIVRSWMNSAGHRANILNGRFREIGVGVAYGAPSQNGGATYTTNFGAKG